jgi:hypothetical protein
MLSLMNFDKTRIRHGCTRGRVAFDPDLSARTIGKRASFSLTGPPNRS